MHYLITGGAGFIGSHLSDYLLKRGDTVTIIDDLSTGSMQNITHLRDHPRFRYLIGTMLNPPLLAEIVDEADTVFHLAAAVGVKLIIESPVRTIETNVRCTELLLEIAAKKKKRVLIASTSEVYGKSTAIPFCEDGDLVMGATTRGRWSYACSKAIDEFLAIAYWNEKQVPTTVCRFFNTVGPRQTGQYGMVVPRFIQQAIENEPLTVYGDGLQSRCFTHVVDAVRAVVGLVDTDATVGQVYNIGNDEEIRMVDLADRIIALTGSTSEKVFVPFSVAYEESFEDMPRRVPNISKIQTAIGWRPENSLAQILETTIAYHRRSATAIATAT